MLALGLEDNVMAVGALADEEDEEEWLRAFCEKEKLNSLDIIRSKDVEMEYKEEDVMEKDDTNMEQDFMEWLLAELRDMMVEEEESVVGVQRQIVCVSTPLRQCPQTVAQTNYHY